MKSVGIRHERSDLQCRSIYPQTGSDNHIGNMSVSCGCSESDSDSKGRRWLSNDLAVFKLVLTKELEQLALV